VAGRPLTKTSWICPRLAESDSGSPLVTSRSADNAGVSWPVVLPESERFRARRRRPVDDVTAVEAQVPVELERS